MPSDRPVPQSPRVVTELQGVTWRIREMDSQRVPGAHGARCLIFDSDRACRRVWSYPANWRELSDVALLALLRGPVPDDMRENVRQSSRDLSHQTDSHQSL